MTDTNKPDALTQEVADHAATALAEARARCDELRTLQAETQAAIDEALHVQDAIWDAVGGQRDGESLVDAVRRTARQRDEIVASYNHAQEWLAKIVDAAEIREGEDLLEAVQRLARSARRALPKPERVEVGQWWVFEDCEPERVTRLIDDGEDLFVYTDGDNDAADWVDQASVMLASPRWRCLGNGERPIDPTDGAWSGAIPPEQLQAAVDRMSTDEKEMLASLVSSGESKVGGYYAQQFGAPAGCMCTWITRPQSDGTTLTERGRGAVPCPVHDTRSEEARMGETSETTSDGCGYCGDPACAEVPAQDGKAVVARSATTAPAEPAPIGADERWQPGAVWAHRRVRRYIITEVDGSLVSFAGHMPIDRAEMTELNGWRYVGRYAWGRPPAEEADPLAEHLNAAVERDEQSAIERAHADGIVEGLRQARRIVGAHCKDPLRREVDEEIATWIEKAAAAAAPADRQAHVDRAAPPDGRTGGTWAGRARDDGSVVIYDGNAPVAVLGAAEVQKLAAEVTERAHASSVPVDRAALLALAEGWETASNEEAGLAVAAPSGSPERTRHNANDRMLDRCARDIRRLLSVPRGPGNGERATAVSGVHSATHGGVTVTAPKTMTLRDVWRALSSSPALRVCLDGEKRRAADAAYQRGQEGMRERAAKHCADVSRSRQAIGKFDEAIDLLGAHYAIRSLPIVKTPTASAGEDPDEAVPGEVRGAETAGAGESIAQRFDLASRWSEQAGARRQHAQREDDRSARAYHDGCADTYATCAGELKDWLSDRAAEGEEVARLKRDLIEASKKRDADIDVWRAATGCETPADARREREADRAAMAKMQDRIAEIEREAKRNGAASVTATRPDVEPWAGDGAQVRAPRVGDMVDLRVNKGVHPCVVLHVWDDGSVNLRDLFDLDEVEGARRGDGIGCWRFRG